MGVEFEKFLSLGHDDTALQRFAYAVELARRRYPSMTIGAFATFLSIARQRAPEGVTATELGEALGQPLPSIFRQCSQLADGLPGKPGMKLIKKLENTEDGRSRKMTLTLNGLDLLTAIIDIISADTPEFD